MYKLFTTIIIFVSLVSNAVADSRKDGVQLHLFVTENQEVHEDVLLANLRYETEQNTAQKTQHEINQIMEKAINIIKEHPEIQVSTRQYSVYKYHRRINSNNPSQKIWKGSQSLQIKGTNADLIKKITGQLQAMGLAINNLNYVASTNLIETTSDLLIDKAIHKLLLKAKRIATSIDKNDIQILNLNVNTHNNSHPRPNNIHGMRHKAVEMETSTPQALPGSLIVSTSINATILIKD